MTNEPIQENLLLAKWLIIRWDGFSLQNNKKNKKNNNIQFIVGDIPIFIVYINDLLKYDSSDSTVNIKQVLMENSYSRWQEELKCELL